MTGSEVYQYDELTLIGEAPEILNNLIETRGVGIVDVFSALLVQGNSDQNKVEFSGSSWKLDPDKRYDR